MAEQMSQLPSLPPAVPGQFSPTPCHQTVSAQSMQLLPAGAGGSAVAPAGVNTDSRMSGSHARGAGAPRGWRRHPPMCGDGWQPTRVVGALLWKRRQSARRSARQTLERACGALRPCCGAASLKDFFRFRAEEDALELLHARRQMRRPSSLLKQLAAVAAACGSRRHDYRYALEPGGEPPPRRRAGLSRR